MKIRLSIKNIRIHGTKFHEIGFNEAEFNGTESNETGFDHIFIGRNKEISDQSSNLYFSVNLVSIQVSLRLNLV